MFEGRDPAPASCPSRSTSGPPRAADRGDRRRLGDRSAPARQERRIGAYPAVVSRRSAHDRFYGISFFGRVLLERHIARPAAPSSVPDSRSSWHECRHRCGISPERVEHRRLEDDARDFSFARLEEGSRRSAEPVPAHISDRSRCPKGKKNGTFASPASARASRVLRCGKAQQQHTLGDRGTSSLENETFGGIRTRRSAPHLLDRIVHARCHRP